MARVKLHLQRPITDFELDLEETQLEVLGWKKVINCKNCKHWMTVIDNAEFGLCLWKGTGTRHKDDYCSGAERKQEDECNQKD